MSLLASVRTGCTGCMSHPRARNSVRRNRDATGCRAVACEPVRVPFAVCELLLVENTMRSVDSSRIDQPPGHAIWPLIAAATLAFAIFIIDAFTPLRITIAALYVLVVMLVAISGSRMHTLVAAFGCVALTLLGYVLSYGLSDAEDPLLRRVVSLLAIFAAMALALRNQATRDVLHDRVRMLKQAREDLARSEAFLADAQQLSRTGQCREAGARRHDVLVARGIPDSRLRGRYHAGRIAAVAARSPGRHGRCAHGVQRGAKRLRHRYRSRVASCDAAGRAQVRTHRRA